MTSLPRNRRHFAIAGITVCLESELDFDSIRFKGELETFAAAGPGDDNVTLRHHFEWPDWRRMDLGKEVYRKAPWAISRKDGQWFYQGILPPPDHAGLHRLAVFTDDHTHGTIYSPPHELEWIRSRGWPSLSLFPTDQIWLGPLLADREAVLIHSAAAILDGQGLLFVGHSEAGKSTTVTMLKAACSEKLQDAHLRGNGNPDSPPHVAILCDDRNIVRRWPDGFRVHGTWSHGDAPDVSASAAPLRAILFLRQDKGNTVEPLADRREIMKRLLATLIRPMVTAEWWRKELDVLERIVQEVPCHIMRFDRTGAIVAELERLVR